MRLLQLCNTFHLPIVYFADEPGCMVGLDEEKRGIVRVGARVVCATSETRMPWITFIVRQLYGVAGACHIRPPEGMTKRYAWLSANWGSMHIEGGTMAAYLLWLPTAGRLTPPPIPRLNVRRLNVG